MINIKYYVFLMVGIFLAIGLGIMIGITLENQNIIENQQTLLIRQIEDRFVSLRTETDVLQKNLHMVEEQRNQLYELSNMLMREIVRDKLSGVHVSLISFAEQPHMGDLLDFLNLTGATVHSAITFSNPITESELAASISSQRPDEMITAIIDDLMFSMSFGGKTQLLQEAEELKLISNTGGYEYPIDIIILIGKGDTTYTYDRLLIERALETGIQLIAVEMGGMDDSAISKYKSYGISTIDHIDSIYGQLALASVLNGNKGNFGFGIDSEDLLPSPLFMDTNGSIPNQTMTANGEELQ